MLRLRLCGAELGGRMGAFDLTQPRFILHLGLFVLCVVQGPRAAFDLSQ